MTDELAVQDPTSGSTTPRRAEAPAVKVRQRPYAKGIRSARGKNVVEKQARR